LALGSDFLFGLAGARASVRPAETNPLAGEAAHVIFDDCQVTTATPCREAPIREQI